MNTAAFDTLASGYDRDFTHSLVGAAQRRTVWDTLDRCLARQSRPCSVLELNCGTGEDALHMARAGHRVLATDVSHAMLQVASDKLARAGLGGAAQTRPLDLQALASGHVTAQELGGRFDLVFSNFGGLNCLSPSALQALAAPLASCLAPGGQIIAVVMPRLCLWESAWALLQLRPRLAARRWRGGPVPAQLSLGQPPLPVWFHGVQEMDGAWHTHFERTLVRPVGLAVPPSAREALASRAPGWLALMERLDRRWLTAAWGARLSDHVLIQYRRR
ncbi:MAG TPA: methyltransferase domain-containing protein [Ideonella sp.]|uniref:class I SAM-dependent methyltransferase n=1 Tax=Ideonella sp. TaxID=1929293 RepID=UPI002C8E0B79|nr:methyltransferase domain-containing protein [Ideonella sp.]HSI48900.1 methyltransferase domain-containing protein [Ideonella sp.]